VIKALNIPEEQSQRLAMIISHDEDEAIHHLSIHQEILEVPVFEETKIMR